MVSRNGYKVWLFEKTDDINARIWLLRVESNHLATDQSTLVAQVLTAFPAPGIPTEHGRMITAADLNSVGTSLLIRVYTGIYEYHLSTPYALEELSQIEPNLITLGPLTEPQGEAITYGWRDHGIWSISESPNSPQDLHHFPCLSP